MPSQHHHPRPLGQAHPAQQPAPRCTTTAIDGRERAWMVVSSSSGSRPRLRSRTDRAAARVRRTVIKTDEQQKPNAPPGQWSSGQLQGPAAFHGPNQLDGAGRRGRGRHTTCARPAGHRALLRLAVAHQLAAAPSASCVSANRFEYGATSAARAAISMCRAPSRTNVSNVGGSFARPSESPLPPRGAVAEDL